MWSHDVVLTSIGLAQDLKIGQYLKISPREMFLTQVWGTILGAIVNYVVMVSVVDAQREILLDPIGTNIWRYITFLSEGECTILIVLARSSGQNTQSLNSAAVTWSLAKELYGPGGPYVWIPLSLVFGMVPTIIQWAISKISLPAFPRFTHVRCSSPRHVQRWPVIGGV